MDQWYYDEAGEQRGPVSENEIKALLTSRKVSSNTLVWRDGMTQWTPLGSIPSFELSPYATPVSGGSPEIDWEGYEPSGIQIRPWIRYWARTMDFLCFSMAVGALLGFVAPEWLETVNDTLFGVILLFLYCFVEPIFFVIWGTTPFKALLRVRVRNNDGSRLGFRQALTRCFNVWARGNGLGLPLFGFIANLISFSRLRENGTTPWDASGHHTVSHQKIEWWRWLVLLAPLVMFIWLIYLGTQVE